jgi:hypothetical protein
MYKCNSPKEAMKILANNGELLKQTAAGSIMIIVLFCGLPE